MKRSVPLTSEDKSTIKKIVETVSELTYVHEKDIMGRKRDAEIVDARHLVWFFCVRFARIPMVACATHFKVTHGAVHYGHRALGYRLILDETGHMKRTMEKIAKELKCEHLAEMI